MVTKDAGPHFVWAQDGRATCDGHDLSELADSYPTPFYLVSVGQLRDNFQRFRRAFSGIDDLRIYYSIKSNYESVVVRTMVEEGAGGEISGSLDLELCKRAGIEPDRVVYDCPRKSSADLEAAVEYGVHLIDLESMSEAKRLDEIAGRMGKKVKVGMRIDPLLPRPYYDALITTYKRKFGFTLDKALGAAVQIRAMKNLELVSLMAHTGSHFFTPKRYLLTLEKFFGLMVDLKHRGIEISEINLGGGYPAPHMNNFKLGRRFVVAQVLERMGKLQTEVQPIEEFGRAICERYQQLASNTGLRPSLAVEPGRALISDACAMVGRVDVVKEGWVFTDISINDLPENLFFSEWRLWTPGRRPHARGQRYNVSGPTLLTQDVLFFDKEIAEPAEGMPIAVMDCGGYSIARASQFTRPRNAVYYIDDDGQMKVARRAESVEDVLRTQVWDELSADEAKTRSGVRKIAAKAG